MPTSKPAPAERPVLPTNGPLGAGALFIGSAIAYWVGLRLAFELGDMADLAAVFFVPAGVTLGILVRTPSTRWWLVLTAAALVEFATDLDAGLPARAAVGFAAANCAEPLVGATLMLRWADGNLALARRRSVAAFVVGPVVIGPLVGALIGATIDYAVNADDWWETLWQWWLGDALGVLVVGGVILSWTSSETRASRQDRWRFVALTTLGVGLPFVTSGLSDVPLEFLTMASVIVAGGVVGARGVTTVAALAAVSTAVVLGTEDTPVWIGVADATAWATIKGQLGVATVAGLALAAEIHERQEQAATVVLARAERQGAVFTRRILDQLVSFVTVLTPDGIVVDTNHAPLRADGDSSSDLIGRPVWEAPWWRHSPAAQQQLADAVADAAGGTSVVYDVPMRIGDVDVWVELQLGPLRDESGTITHLIKSCVDLTERREAQFRLAATAAAERETRQRVELLGRVATNLASAMTIDDIAHAVLADIRLALGLEVGVLNVLHGDEIHIHPAQGAHLPEEHSLGLGSPLPGPRAIASNSAVVLDSIDGIAEQFPAGAGAGVDPPLKSVAAFPTSSDRSDARGALVLGAPEAEWFTADRTELLAGIATQAGQAIRRAHLHAEVVAARDREHSIALRLQDALLPDRLVRHRDVDIAARYLAAAESLMVGGDWYDTFMWPDGHIGLMVGDVVGHDLEAAATMGRLRAALAALVPLGPPDPVAVLDALDACANGPDGVDFVTAACVVVDPARRRLAYASAGHPPPLLLTPGHEPTWLDQAATAPAGRLLEAHRTRCELDLPPDSIIVLFTDGLIERRGTTITDGLDRLACAAQEVSAQPVPGTRHWVDSLLARLGGDAVDDDVAVLVARFGPVSEPFHHRFPAAGHQLRDLRRRLRVWLDAHDVAQRDQGDVLLAIGEAATNAIEHAYEYDRTGTITVDVHRDGDELVACITDHGTWREPVPDPQRRRGTMIMEAVTTGFSSTTDADGTRVTLRLAAPRREAVDRDDEGA